MELFWLSSGGGQSKPLLRFGFNVNKTHQRQIYSKDLLLFPKVNHMQRVPKHKINDAVVTSGIWDNLFHFGVSTVSLLQLNDLN